MDNLGGHIQSTFENTGNVANQAGQQVVYGDININHPDEDLLKLLPSAAQAAFNSYDKWHDPLCLPNTRVDVLKQIIVWADRRDEKCIFWLNGMAGTGKSTIARTVARKYYDQNRLGASFFFSKGGGDVSHARKLFTSLAAQLASKSLSLKRYICEAIAEHRGIANQTLGDQWNQLLLRPLSKLEAHSIQSPLILVIDALDECEGENDIRGILQLLAGARALRTIRLRIFITSRPETPIRHGFYQISETGHEDFILHNISASIIDRDISIFLEHNLRIISRELFLATDWPGEQTVKSLVQSAGGLFIWAATACRFVRDGKRFAEGRLSHILQGGTSSATPEDKRIAGGRLSLILQGGTSAATPEEKLDEIYIAILTSSVSDKYDDQEIEELYTVLKATLGAIVTLFSSLSTTSLARLLHIPKRDIDQTLDDLHSILEVPKDQDHPVRLHHPSFRDFLLDQQRCGDPHFWVDEKKAHGALAGSCLLVMSNSLRRDICGLHAPGALVSNVHSNRIQKCLPSELQYACRYWVQHLQRSGDRLFDNDPVSKFLQKHFLHWLEALSLIGKTSDSIYIITALQSMVLDKDSYLYGLIHDATRFILYNRSIIEEAPLQLYYAALVFAPEMSAVRRQFLDQFPCWICRLPEIQKDWSSALQILEGHSNSVNAVAFSPDGQLLASASLDKTVRLWDTTTGAPRGTLEGHSRLVNAVAFSPDGQLLASMSNDGTVRLWDTTTGAPRGILMSHSDWARAVAFSPNGQLLASASDEKTVRLWDTTTGAPRGILMGHSGSVSAVAFSPDGQLLASASNDKTVRLWDTTTGAPRGTFKGHLGSVKAVAFLLDGQLLTSISHDNTVRLWDTTTGAPRGTFKGHLGWIRAATFSSDGQLLASVSNNEKVQLWDITTGAPPGTLEGHPNSVNAVAFSPDGQLLASASDDKAVRLWDITTEAPRGTLKGHSGSVSAVAFSPNGQLLASTSDDRTVRLWDTTTGAPRGSLKGHSGWITAVAFSPDGQLLASASNDKTVRLWNTTIEAPRGTLEGHSDSVFAVAFSPNGQLLASTSVDKTVRLWDTTTGAPRGILKSHSDSVSAVAFSPDGQLLASASGDKTVRLWNTTTGVPRGTLKGHLDWVEAVAFSPNGQLLASTSVDKTVRLWDTTTGAPRGTLEGHSGSVSAVAFSPNGQLLASTSRDKTVRLWDMTTKEMIQELNTDTIISKLSFTSDGSHLDTDRGILKLRLPTLCEPSSQFNSPSPLYVNQHWVTWRNKNILRLPPDYRASCVAVRHNILVMGHASGRVTFTEFDSNTVS